MSEGIWTVLLVALVAAMAIAAAAVVARRLRARRRRDLDRYGPPAPASSAPPAAAPPPPTAEEVPQAASRGTPPAAPPPETAATADRPVDAALRQGLSRTQASLLGRIRQALGRSQQFDEAMADELEEALLLADVGVGLSVRLIQGVREQARQGPLLSVQALTAALSDAMVEALTLPEPQPARADGGGTPRVILFVGVNGVGKTTTIGKVAAALVAAGSKVMLAAGDTFRAAAAEQLQIWAERAGSGFHRGEAEADPASVIFAAIVRARGEGADVVLADTAGRLHTHNNLMDEIAKVRRAADKALGTSGTVEAWLVVDGTTGQNALQQAREFDRAVGLTGIVLTKLDGTAKGGVVVAIVDALKVPIRYLGVGEGVGDLRPFDARHFVAALLTPP